ncbi:MAG: Crp/Fnr family transcriptional regulator [Terrimicrobiaceae bacterium]|nr:Crp/Fnr family transcriptional regulator [Terrimicrobiaceae bacterium]
MTHPSARKSVAARSFPAIPHRANSAGPSRARKPAEAISGFRQEAVCYFLRRADIFADLAEADLRDLAEAAVLKTLGKGAYLFHKNDVAPGIYLVRRGIINFHRVAVDGREIVIHFYRAGEMLAEIAAGAGEGCPADARAVLPSEVIVIPRRTFLAKFRQCPDLALRLLTSLDLQIHRLADSLEDFVSRSAATRFVQWLLRQGVDESSHDTVEIHLGTTKRALAGELGVRQETLSRILRELSDFGLLRVCGRKITITNPGALRATLAAGLPAAA